MSCPNSQSHSGYARSKSPQRCPECGEWFGGGDGDTIFGVQYSFDGGILVRADSEEEAVRKAEEWLSNTKRAMHNAAGPYVQGTDPRYTEDGESI